ncbi:MAG: Trk system potassium transporter TrkA [Gammaproteobacteria bacterium]|nr:MAG: Trk system potassium transporter TrkA [Gammaproteobacteria bacterium]
MHIIILGAGQVGGTLAKSLEGEDNEITLVDVCQERLDELHNHLDLRTICGQASHPDILAKAGAENTDLLIAVTNSDETNMIACQIAWLLFKIPTKIARVRDPSYLNNKDMLFDKDTPGSLTVDVVISPEQVVTEHIFKLIRYPGALQVLDFAKGLVRLVAVKAYYGGPLVGNALATLKQHIPNVDTRVAAIFRQGKPIVPIGSTIIEANDEVFFIAEKNDITKVISELQKLEDPYKKIMIAGGGHIGAGLAHALEAEGCQVKVIERNRDHARELSAELDGTVINADAADKDMLIEENIEDMDVFIAVTNNDAANIMSSMLAKSLGGRKVMALINRPEYVDLAQSSGIDIAISPQMATIGSLLTYIRQGDIATVYSLRRGAAEAIETIAHGDSHTSRVVGRRIEELKLPPGTTIGAIVRGDSDNEKILMAHDDVVIESDDHVILFLVDKQYVHEVERLFQVDATFI